MVTFHFFVSLFKNFNQLYIYKLNHYKSWTWTSEKKTWFHKSVSKTITTESYCNHIWKWPFHCILCCPREIRENIWYLCILGWIITVSIMVWVGSILLKKRGFHSFLWLSCVMYIYTFCLSSHPLLDIWDYSIS